MKLLKKESGEKREGRAKSLSSQIMVMNTVALILAVAIASTISAACMARSAKKIAQESASADLVMMESQFQEISESLIGNGTAMAANESFVDLLTGTGSYEAAAAKLESLSAAFRIESIALFSSDLQVMAAVGGYSIGANLHGVESINDVFNGEPVTTVAPSAAYDYAINAMVPIRVNNTVVGGILLSENLADSAFVDNLKEQTGNEYTIFLGNLRLVTTLTDSAGQRLVGTAMGADIEKTVLDQRDKYIGTAKIGNGRYFTCYTPILAPDGSATGALFAGYNLASYYSSVKWSTITVVIVAILLSILTSLIDRRFLKTRMKRPLDQIMSSVEDFADGDMSRTSLDKMRAIQVNNEIGSMATCMESSISGIANHMTSIKSISNAINGRSSQVSESADTLAQGATEQASAVEELSTTISSIVAQVNTNAKNAAGAADASRNAEDKVLNSNEQMESMVAAMKEIYSTSQEISAIVKTIDDLAFQTNILSLNAAVEAARAGTQGKGFAVIASEVQNLAGKSAAAAKNTASLVDNALRAVEKGTEYAGSVADSLKGVVEQTTQVNNMVAEISDAANSEVQLLYQVNEGISQISTVVQTNSEIAEETASASQGLKGEAHQLNEMISQYKLDDIQPRAEEIQPQHTTTLHLQPKTTVKRWTA
jgi:methyl-accepting chemotaxis protein